jgi:HEAT repeat protein
VAAVDDADKNVSTAALDFLGSFKGVVATQKLVGFLKRPALRARAQAALTVPGEHRVAGLLAALRTADDEVAAFLTTILVRLHYPGAIAALFEALTFTNVAARKAAATTLGALGSREAYAALQRLAEEDSDPELRRVCSLHLGQ